MEKRQLTCIGCPLGCALEVTVERHLPVAVTGHTCKRGETYAHKEITNPTRTLTTTLPVLGGTSLPVKTAGEVPKSAIFAVMAALKGITLSPPIALGDVVVPNIAGTGIHIIATAASTSPPAP